MLAILAAVMLAAAPQHDTVYLADGGRVVGTVVEEGAKGIAVQLPDGTFRRFPRGEVLKIQYADGSVSTIRSAEPAPSQPPQPAQPAPQYAPPPPPRYAPPPPPRYAPPPPQYAPPRRGPPAYPPPYPAQSARAYTGPISPFYLTFGIGAAFPAGKAESGFDLSEVIGPQADFNFEAGLRLNPHDALGLYGAIGVGDPGRPTRDFCNANGFVCNADTRRIGILFRHTFEPAARQTPWFSIGTGYETATTSDDVFGDLVKYKGWEIARLMVGYDFRTSQVFGVGLYAGVSIGHFSNVEDLDGTHDISGTHERFETGLRFTLFP